MMVSIAIDCKKDLNYSSCFPSTKYDAKKRFDLQIIVLILLFKFVASGALVRGPNQILYHSWSYNYSGH